MGDKLTVGSAVFGPTFAEKAGVVQTGASAEHVLPVDNDMLRRRIAAIEAENAKMKEALKKISKGQVSGPPGLDERFESTCIRELVVSRDIARAALT